MACKSLKGLFITFEGPEGSGKTTHSRLFYEYLKRRGYDCVYTREPGGTRLGEAIRTVLLHSKDIAISDLAELFLFEACRAQIVKEVICPSLMQKKIVICDRFGDATISYQGYAGGIPASVIKKLNDTATGSLKPDITILLDIDTYTGLKRAASKGTDRMEKKDVNYHKKVRAGYLRLARENPGRIKVIKVAGSIDETQELVRCEAERAIRKYKRP